MYAPLFTFALTSLLLPLQFKPTKMLSIWKYNYEHPGAIRNLIYERHSNNSISPSQPHK